VSGLLEFGRRASFPQSSSFSHPYTLNSRLGNHSISRGVLVVPLIHSKSGTVPVLFKPGYSFGINSRKIGLNFINVCAHLGNYLSHVRNESVVNCSDHIERDGRVFGTGHVSFHTNSMHKHVLFLYYTLVDIAWVLSRVNINLAFWYILRHEVLWKEVEDVELQISRLLCAPVQFIRGHLGDCYHIWVLNPFTEEVSYMKVKANSSTQLLRAVSVHCGRD
jgi:hypothetical protein